MANTLLSALPALMIALTMAACESIPAPKPVRGFPADELAALAQRESVLTSTPDTARLRSYMLAMTEEAHHTGSPGAKAVAEYALARFREWGLDAQIEEFEALVPFPVLRRVELVSPTRFVARMEERGTCSLKTGPAGRLGIDLARRRGRSHEADAIYRRADRRRAA